MSDIQEIIDDPGTQCSSGHPGTPGVDGDDTSQQSTQAFEPKTRAGGKAKKKQQRVRIMLPITSAKDTVVEVVINGKFTRIQRGVPVDVLPEVAEVLAHSSAAELRYMKLEAEINKNNPD